MRREDAPQLICVSDAETSGIDIENDRIITFYAMVQSITGEVIREQSWVIDPGVEIQQGASDVHGMTTEWVRENGRKDVEKAIAEIADFHTDAVLKGIPLVGYNHAFDLGMLDNEVMRHNNVSLMPRALLREPMFFDPLIYDRATDKYRKGGRKLMDVARHYGIQIDESKLHDAKYDVIVTAKLAWILLQKSKWTVQELQPLQKQWKSEWACHLTEYFDKVDKREDDGSKIIVDGSFPYRGASE